MNPLGLDGEAVSTVSGYEHYFGDSWQHEITVAQILSPDAAIPKAAPGLDGARAGLPEVSTRQFSESDDSNPRARE